MKLFRIRNDDFIRCNVEHRAVVAVDVMEYLGNSFFFLVTLQDSSKFSLSAFEGVDEDTSRNWCNCPFGSEFTFSLPQLCSDYVILQPMLKLFVDELVRTNLVSVDRAMDFFTTLRAIKEQERQVNRGGTNV